LGEIFFDSESTPALSGGWTHGFVGALGNKRAFDPLLHICNSHAPREVSIHAGNMTRGKTVGAFPQMCRRSATPPRDRWSFWNRVTGIDRSISGTRAANLSLLVGLNTQTLLPRDYRTYRQRENILKRMEER
jgi:hypothetical protein